MTKRNNAFSWYKKDFRSVLTLSTIKRWENIKTLNLSRTNTREINVLPPKLEKLKCSDCLGLVAITCPLPETLRCLDFRHSPVKSLPPLPDSLVYLVCDYSYIAELPPLPKNLKFLSCRGTVLSTKPLPLGLRVLICGCSEPYLPTIFTSLPPTLNRFECDETRVLCDLPPKLKFLDASYSYFCFDEHKPMVFPDSLEDLCLRGIKLKKRLVTLPPKLKGLLIDRCVISEIPPLPCTLEYLYLNKLPTKNIPPLPHGLLNLCCDSGTEKPRLPKSLSACDDGLFADGGTPWSRAAMLLKEQMTEDIYRWRRGIQILRFALGKNLVCTLWKRRF